VLATEGDKVFALHLQLTRQREDAYFLFLLQAQLLWDFLGVPALHGPTLGTFPLF
jgi:hypothetical protein